MVLHGKKYQRWWMVGTRMLSRAGTIIFRKKELLKKMDISGNMEKVSITSMEIWVKTKKFLLKIKILKKVHLIGKKLKLILILQKKTEESVNSFYRDVVWAHSDWLLWTLIMNVFVIYFKDFFFFFWDIVAYTLLLF